MHDRARERNDGYHRPVLVDEVVASLEPTRGGTFVDGTVGGGGHARALLEAGSDLRLVAADRDPAALDEASSVLAGFGERVRLVHSDFRDLVRAADLEPGSVTGVCLDLGVSSRQLDADARGFTFRRGVDLDMRMDTASRGAPTAADVLNDYDEPELARILREYGEERRARRLAAAIVRRRRNRAFRTSDDLVAAVASALGRAPGAKDKARIFQALRIEVNDELGALEDGLESLRDALAVGGRLAVISYHSLEDRCVKHRFRAWSQECVCPPQLPVCACRGYALGSLRTRRPIRPGPEEIAANPRARSARLRLWERGTGEDRS